jgi:hypothetical protein
MRNAFLAALGAASLCASLSGPAIAQAPIVHLPDRAAMRPGVVAQLDELSSRVDRYVAQGRLSAADADHARREINRIQGEVSDARERNGGRFETADRFELQSQIDKLRREIHRERTSAPQ